MSNLRTQIAPSKDGHDRDCDDLAVEGRFQVSRWLSVILDADPGTTARDPPQAAEANENG
jgi:hypothetical protein